MVRAALRDRVYVVQLVIGADIYLAVCAKRALEH